MLEAGSLLERMDQRMDQEVNQLRQGMLGLHQQLHAEISEREESSSVMRDSFECLEMETSIRLQAMDKNMQSQEDLEIRMGRAVAMLRDEHVPRD